MASRSSHDRQDNSNWNSHSHRGGFRPKSHKQQYVPRSSSSSSNPNFSSSLRRRLEGPSTFSEGNFVNYLPQDEAVAVGLGVEQDPLQSQTVVDLLNAQLAILLKLKPIHFWRQVAVDTSLHEFLDSFLQFRTRWYDFPYHGPKGIVAGVIVGDLELSRRVFILLYRISSNKDPGSTAAMSLSQKDHQVLLQEKKLLDLPKLLDICAVYGHENEDLTRLLVWNAINAQPDIHGRFTPMLSHFLDLVHTMYARCTSKLEALISSGGCVDNRPSQQHIEYLEVMDFINDAVVSMSTFVSAYRPAAVYFSCPIDSSHGNEELTNVLATLHDSLIPALQQGLEIILASENNSSMLYDVSVSLRILSSRLVDIGWKLLDNCYLSEALFKDDFPFPAAMKMFPASVEDPIIRADILVQTFKEIAAVPQHVQGKHYRGTYLQNIERNFQILGRIETLKQSGWIAIDDEQYQYLTGMMTHPMPVVSRKLPVAPESARSDNLQIEEDTAIAESKISQVKDLFPDYGKGFILACLEVYDYNQEEVIQRILEGTLHEDLKRLDTSIETVPPKSSPSMNKKDKGKGILVESTDFLSTNSISQKPKQEPMSFSGSSMLSVGRFVRKSKDNEPNHDPLSLRDERTVEKTADLLLQYEYEDEYDDSFDDLGMTIMESGVEETEILGERLRSTSSRPQTQGSDSSTGTSKWNSKKKPQFYVKDGKNYSYKVEGSIAVSDQKQAALINQVQKELIHGLGRGGNRPLGAAKILEEQNEAEMDDSERSEVDGDGGRGRGRGRGRRGGGRHNHYRKDRALKKHMTGLGGF